MDSSVKSFKVFRLGSYRIAAWLLYVFSLIGVASQAQAMSTCLSEVCECSGARACIVWVTGAGLYKEKNLTDRLYVDFLQHRIGKHLVGYINIDDADFIVLRPTGWAYVPPIGIVHYYTDKDRKIMTTIAKRSAKLGQDLHTMVSSAGVSEFKNYMAPYLKKTGVLMFLQPMNSKGFDANPPLPASLKPLAVITLDVRTDPLVTQFIGNGDAKLASRPDFHAYVEMGRIKTTDKANGKIRDYLDQFSKRKNNKENIASGLDRKITFLRIVGELSPQHVHYLNYSELFAGRNLGKIVSMVKSMRSEKQPEKAIRQAITSFLQEQTDNFRMIYGPPAEAMNLYHQTLKLGPNDPLVAERTDIINLRIKGMRKGDDNNWNIDVDTFELMKHFAPRTDGQPVYAVSSIFSRSRAQDWSINTDKDGWLLVDYSGIQDIHATPRAVQVLLTQPGESPIAIADKIKARNEAEHPGQRAIILLDGDQDHDDKVRFRNKSIIASLQRRGYTPDDIYIVKNGDLYTPTSTQPIAKKEAFLPEAAYHDTVLAQGVWGHVLHNITDRPVLADPVQAEAAMDDLGGVLIRIRTARNGTVDKGLREQVIQGHPAEPTSSWQIRLPQEGHE